MNSIIQVRGGGGGGGGGHSSGGHTSSHTSSHTTTTITRTVGGRPVIVPIIIPGGHAHATGSYTEQPAGNYPVEDNHVSVGAVVMLSMCLIFVLLLVVLASVDD